MPKPHPPTSSTTCQTPVTSGASSSIGNANITANVPALPDPQHVDPPGTRRTRSRASRLRRAPRARGARSRSTATPVGTPYATMPTVAGDEEEPVGGRVEDLAELTPLVQVAGEIPVDPVGRAEERERATRRPRCASVPSSSQRKTGMHDEPHDRDEVRKGEDPSRPGRGGRSVVHRRSVRAPPSQLGPGAASGAQSPRTAPSARGSVAAR